MSEALNHNIATAWRGGCIDTGFLDDLAARVANDGTVDGGIRWLNGFVAAYLQSRGQKSDGWAAFDFAAMDVEALARLWPAFRMAASLHGDSYDCLPNLARYMVERMPAVWDRLGRRIAA